ncbi:MAG TPA: retropepsin-like aspartic protease [Acidobacteriaceae bacterium]|nr:retropepsin-like aspartic protease [Acidobacteriaceae bacterium]
MRGHSLFCISLLSVLLVAGEPPAKGYTDGQAVRFDLYRDYLIVAKGSAGPLKGLHFLLDTGATPTVLDRPLAQKLHLVEMPASIAVLEGSVQAGQATVPSLQFGPLRRDNLNVLIEDLSFFRKALPVHIDAVVGLDVLGQSAFEIDYIAREIRFGPLPSLANSLPLELKAGLPIVGAEMNHLSVHLLVDTGASALILFEPPITRPASPMRISADRSANTIGEFERKQVWLPSLRVGETEFGRKAAFLVRNRGTANQDFDGLMSPAALGITKVGIDLGRGVFAFSR